MTNPGRATMDDVRWLCETLVQLQVDYAEEKIDCFNARQDLDECRERLARAERLLDRLTSRIAITEEKASFYARQVRHR